MSRIHIVFKSRLQTALYEMGLKCVPVFAVFFVFTFYLSGSCDAEVRPFSSSSVFPLFSKTIGRLVQNSSFNQAS